MEGGEGSAAAASAGEAAAKSWTAAAAAHRNLDGDLQILREGFGLHDALKRLVDVPHAAQEGRRLPDQQFVHVEHRLAVGTHAHDGNVQQDGVGEQALDRRLGLRLAGGARLQLRLQQGQAIVVLLPIDVVIRPLQAVNAVHEQMNAKRHRKLAAIARKYPLFRRYGPARAKLGIICWGSSEGVIRDALERMDDPRVAAFVPRMLSPLPTAELQAFVDGCEDILIVELSHSAQFHRVLRTEIDLPRGRTHVHARSGCKPLTVEEVVDAVGRVLAAEEVLV